MALPDTASSQTIILQRFLDKTEIKYNTCGREPIVTANSSSLGCVGNIILDIQIDKGKRLAVDALVAENLSSNCLIAWKDMQRAGLISPLFPAKVHLTKSCTGCNRPPS
jgi:sporulation protein YlmC with PRC-barrel domain